MHDPKVAVVCMVYNSYEYLSEFIVYYSAIVDHIYLIDHKSQRDLRGLSHEKVTVVRSAQEAQFQSECTNAVIRHFNIKEKYDWLFVLDIDEFLPFNSRDVFHSFLRKHKNHKVLQLQWFNGVPFHDYKEEIPESLIDCPDIRFFPKPGEQHKSFVNIRKTRGKFVVPTGSHNIFTTQWWVGKNVPVISRRKSYKPYMCSEPLYHIVAYNKNHFISKIKNYVEQMKYREHIVGQGGWSVRDYPEQYDGDDWLWYIANFRVSKPECFYEAKKQDFESFDVFSHLNVSDVRQIKNMIKALSFSAPQQANAQEKAYLSFKKDDRNILENIAWFSISKENEIQILEPKL